MYRDDLDYDLDIKTYLRNALGNHTRGPGLGTYTRSNTALRADIYRAM